MTTDAAFLEKVSAFLDESDLVLSSGTLFEAASSDEGSLLSDGNTSESILLDNHLSKDATPTKLNTSSGSSRKATQSRKRKAAREKEILRKKRYENRLNNERETLRRMESELSVRLANLQQAKRTRRQGNFLPESSSWKDRAMQEEKQRAQAEAQQKRLVAAVTLQASYLSHLQELQVETTTEKALSTPDVCPEWFLSYTPAQCSLETSL